MVYSGMRGRACSTVSLRSLLFHPQQGRVVPGECERAGENDAPSVTDMAGPSAAAAGLSPGEQCRYQGGVGEL